MGYQMKGLEIIRSLVKMLENLMKIGRVIKGMQVKYSAKLLLQAIATISNVQLQVNRKEITFNVCTGPQCKQMEYTLRWPIFRLHCIGYVDFMLFVSFPSCWVANANIFFGGIWA